MQSHVLSTAKNLFKTVFFVKSVQSSPSCYSRSLYWLQTFFGTKYSLLCSEDGARSVGEKLEVQRSELEKSQVLSGGFYDFEHPLFSTDLSRKMRRFGITLESSGTPLSTSSLDESLNLEDKAKELVRDYLGMVFMSEANNTKDNPGHAISYAFRANPDPSQHDGIFAIFDANEGYLVIHLTFFPVPFEIYSVCPWQDTLLPDGRVAKYYQEFRGLNQVLQVMQEKVYSPQNYSDYRDVALTINRLSYSPFKRVSSMFRTSKSVTKLFDDEQETAAATITANTAKSPTSKLKKCKMSNMGSSTYS